ncbi:hypothetical protein ESY86_03975 [Subsaximicrobium wynnwilliamsii]|uniref:Threonine synthase n=1 Tax=Subsaximicrobium wynnwilliamsii TaxID=291179 RepID=A0A5C6ZNF6_9FLAO|nr:DUF6503 family protein [Subsaximicrobium wynnwilliamsii]TXD84862.1 hypothetical protein ESY87_03755 [Subsaximicrobium wynnwilliamsii]TXD90533.1 hypothetical protein ESY86_03975 [Subsaximicrobium wynnwilliamsii]TXE05008.1 hypothetical protein ESY88_02280 [Subsaximicrobium wynnwilliamsii]
MKLKIILIVLSLVFAACKDANSERKPVGNEQPSEVKSTRPSLNYPENLSKVFEAHGGIGTWNAMNTLKFTMDKEGGDEITTTDLKNRKSLIQMPKHHIGFDGENVWLQKADTTSYKGNPKFYYNLMFYFYAMPFVLGDDGIIYENIAPLQFEGKSYPGIKISYKAGVGESPEDNYVMYYDSETYQMAWLGYTVTFFTNEKEEAYHFIKYRDWQTLNGLTLPKTLTWYNYENNLPTTKQRDLEFSDVLISEEKMDDSMFNLPEGAEVVQ